jgi:hypothetical protein
MRLRLDPELLDGRSSAEFDSRLTTLNVTVNAPGWHGQTRIVPGSPEQSLLVTLISNRGTNNPASNQMPPIASRVVDRASVEKVVQWIRSMPAPPTPVDAAVPDSPTMDATVDAPEPDAGVDIDASEPPDGGADDADPTDSAADAGGSTAVDAGGM